MKKIVNESLFEFNQSRINATDSWEEPEEDEIVDDIDIDTSDMDNAEEIEVEDEPFDDELSAALSVEIKVPEYNRASLQFSVKGNDDEILSGVPMAKLSGGSAFLFKMQDGSMKKFYLKDLIVEQKKTKRKKKLNEILHDDDDDDMNSSNWVTNEDSEFNEDPPNYILTDGRKIKMIEGTMFNAIGEDMLFYYFIDENDNRLVFKDIKKYLEDNDYDEIKEITDATAQQNKENEYEG